MKNCEPGKKSSLSPTERAQVLIEALPYIQRFHDVTIVVKYGGSAMENPALVESVLRDIVLLNIVGINVVLVHGGGKAITQRMKDAGLQPKFVSGYRTTDDVAMKIVEEVLDRVINPDVVGYLERLGGLAMGFSGKKIFTARKTPPVRLSDGTEADLGLVGEVVSVNDATLSNCIHHGIIPVVTPLGLMEDGKTVLNMNADVAAMEMAITLKAAKLIYLSDVPGVLRNPKDETSIISTICAADIPALKAEAILSGGMLPKVESALNALQRGVGKVQFIDGRLSHSLLLELFTDLGVGTEIVMAK